MKQFDLLLIIWISLIVISCEKTDLYEYPSSNSYETSITSFSLLNEYGENVIIDVKIDSVAKVINTKVIDGTSIDKLIPRATVSEGVIVDPIMGVYTDFTNPVVYTLVAGNRINKDKWTIIVSF